MNNIVLKNLAASYAVIRFFELKFVSPSKINRNTGRAIDILYLE